jgi:hypothetical protein
MVSKTLSKLGFSNCFEILIVGLSGGLALGWNPPWEATIVHSSHFFIHTHIKNHLGDLCSITFIYGHPVLAQRKLIWEELESLSNQILPKWLFIRDFNQVLSSQDKFTFKLGPISSNLDLLQTISNLSLIPIESKGFSHTWMNKRQAENFVMEKLDRAFGSIEWMDTYPHSLVRNLPIICLDHGPILLDTECRPPFKHHPFRFEWMWTTHPECANLIHETWNNSSHPGSHAFCLKKKLETPRDTFKVWNKTSFCRVEKQMEEKKEELRRLQEHLSSLEDVKMEKEFKEHVEDLMHKEELMWAQKAKTN